MFADRRDPTNRITPVLPAGADVRTDAPRPILLTVALEDYFQVGSFNQLIQRGQWYRFEPRLERNTRHTLDLLDRYGIKATFFILGWIADRFPELVRQVAERGHEIASKGYHHRSIRQMTPDEFRDELARSRAALERASGKRVHGYRVAHEWFTPDDLWALDVLAEEGYAYDSSIGPILRRFADEPFRRFAHQYTPASFPDRRIWEFPFSTLRWLGYNIPIAGGNYIRQFPHWFVRRGVARWHSNYTAPFVMYFHVWELDPEQPHIAAGSFLTRVRHYRNLGKMQGRLEHYFQRYSFTSIARYLGLSDETIATPPEADSRNSAPSSVELTYVCNEAPRPVRTPVTILVPCYNEELIVPYLANTLASVEKALERDYDLRFLLIDDGSQDNTFAALQKTFGGRPNFELLMHEQNRGVAAAIRTGLAAARTEVVCSIDCDCTYDPHELRHMIPLLSPSVDLVTGSPYHPQGQVRNVPRWRLGLSRSSSWLYRRVLGSKIYTFTSCFRVYRRSSFINLPLREDRYLGVAEMLARLVLNGGKVVEYPTVLEVRMLGRSKMKTLRTILGHVRLMTRLFTSRMLGTKPTPSLLLPKMEAEAQRGERPGPRCASASMATSTPAPAAPGDSSPTPPPAPNETRHQEPSTP